MTWTKSSPDTTVHANEIAGNYSNKPRKPSSTLFALKNKRKETYTVDNSESNVEYNGK